MILKSIGAVLAGVIVVVVGTIALDKLFTSIGVLPTNEPMGHVHAILATSYRVLVGVGAAWLTARLAPKRPMAHALILGGLGTALAIVGVIVTWNQDLGPRWYALGLVVLAIPQSWLGAMLSEARSEPGGEPEAEADTTT